MINLETKIREKLEKARMVVLKRGWPDFLVVDVEKQRAYCLEVKDCNDRLSVYQKEMHVWLKRLGIPVYVVRNAGNIKKHGRVFLTEKTKLMVQGEILELDNQLKTNTEIAENIKQRISELREHVDDTDILLEQQIMTPEEHVVFEPPEGKFNISSPQRVACKVAANKIGKFFRGASSVNKETGNDQ